MFDLIVGFYHWWSDLIVGFYHQSGTIQALSSFDSVLQEKNSLGKWGAIRVQGGLVIGGKVVAK